MLHARHKWPSIITTVFWPYTIQSIIKRYNRLSLDAEGRIPLEKFARIDDNFDPNTFHTCGCPVFILDAENQPGGLGTPKWETRSHTGIYVGHSPCHTGTVALVLDLTTGLVSP